MKLNKMDIWCIVSPIIMLIICIVTKTGWLQMGAGITGVIYISLIAKQNKLGYAFSIINVIFYAILTWTQGLVGTALFNLIYSLPVLIYGYIFWNKNQNNDKGEVKALSNKNRLKIIFAMLGIIAVYYFAATNLFEMENALMDGIVVCFSFIGNFLMARKYIEQWIVWISLNCINLIFWGGAALTDPNQIAIVVMWIMYLINNVIGVIAWSKNK